MDIGRKEHIFKSLTL